MSGRHRVRLLEEKQYMCSARGCKFKGTYDEGVAHINVENRKRDAVIPPGMTEVKPEVQADAA